MRLLIALLFVLASFLSGCANTSEYLRTQPATHFQPKAADTDSKSSGNIAVPSEVSRYVSLYCMEEFLSINPIANTKPKQCLYMSAEIGNASALGNDAADRITKDRIVNFLVNVSDMNCSNFLHRAFANKAGLDLTKSFISDLSTGISAGTAHANPAVSAALSVGNLVIGKGVESFNATYYFDKTFQALESAINAERTKLRTLIFARQAKARNGSPANEYEINHALSDIRGYDDACSIKAGLSQLVQFSDAKKNEELKNKVTVEHAANPAIKVEEIYGRD